MEHQDLFNKIINHIGYLLNSSHPEEDIHKMIALEMTTNPDNASLEYIEIMHIVVMRLVEFYNDETLENMWYDYLDYESVPEDKAA